MTVEGEELVGARRMTHALESIAQIVAVAVEKALLLDEVDEHQSVQHQRRVPLGVLLAAETGNEAEESVVFRLEAVVEALRDTLDVEGGARPPSDVDDRQASLLV